MKNKLKKVFPAILSVLSVIFVFSCRNLSDDNTYSSELAKHENVVNAESLIKQESDIYTADSSGNPVHYGKINLYFTKNGEEKGDIPYVEIEDYLDTCIPNKFIVRKNESLYKIINKEDQVLCFTIDFSDGSLCYNDLDYNISTSDTEIYDGKDCSYVRKLTSLYEKGGNPACSINLKDYSIPLKFENGYGFIPPSVLLLFLLRTKENFFIYNGKDVFLDKNSYYKNPAYSEKIASKQESYSQDFADFNYNFSCLAFDFLYGRKDYIGITNFGDWFTNIGIKKELKSTNIFDAESALVKILNHHISEFHTYLGHSTPFLGLNENQTLFDYETCNYPKSQAYIEFTDYGDQLYYILYTAQNTSYYAEYNNMMNIYIKNKTLFLALEDFQGKYVNDPDFYKNLFFNTPPGSIKGLAFFISNDTGDEALLEPFTPAETDKESGTVDGLISEIIKNPNYGYGISLLSDPVKLTVIANHIVNKLNVDENNKRIENVVVDISLNVGGSPFYESFMASWFLGRADWHYKNNRTGTKYSLSFIADVDFDENFNSIEDFAIDSDDNICDLNRYCIISNESFSAANYFAFQARASKRVKLFGSKSSGGNCFVMEVCTPAGTVFSTSSFMEVFSLHNGGFVGIEDGVAPDICFQITEFDKVYDRNKFYNKYLKDQ